MSTLSRGAVPASFVTPKATPKRATKLSGNVATKSVAATMAAAEVKLGTTNATSRSIRVARTPTRAHGSRDRVQVEPRHGGVCQAGSWKCWCQPMDVYGARQGLSAPYRALLYARPACWSRTLRSQHRPLSRKGHRWTARCYSDYAQTSFRQLPGKVVCKARSLYELSSICDSECKLSRSQRWICSFYLNRTTKLVQRATQRRCQSRAAWSRNFPGRFSPPADRRARRKRASELLIADGVT